MANTTTAHDTRIGVIDIGSNTVLLLVLERGGAVVREASRITRLGQGVFTAGQLAPEAAERTRLAVAELCALARAAGAERVVAVGTEALRRARDGAAFLTGLAGPDQTFLLSGEQEAACAIEASRRAHGAGGPLLVIDVGGGSTELAWTDGSVARGISLPVGSVRLTEAWLPEHPIPAAQLAHVRGLIEAAASPLGTPPATPPARARVVAVAGTATTLAALEQRMASYDRDRVEGFVLSCETLRRWLAQLSLMSVDERLRLPGLEPGRADVIVAGLLILDVLLGRLGSAAFEVSGRGVRHGVALRILEGAPGF